jgi:hypothetical protein
MRLTLAIVTLVSAVLLVPSIAHADKPTALGPFSEEGVYSPVLECPDFQVANHYVSNLAGRITADRQGNVTRLSAHAWGVDTYVNMNTGKELTSRYNDNMTVDVRTGEGTIRGVISKVVVPGVGLVVKDVGRIAFDRDGNVTFSAGTHQWFDGDVQALCEALE